MFMMSSPSWPTLWCGAGATLVILVIAFDIAMSSLLALSILTLMGWIRFAVVVHDFDSLDEGDKYEIGADAGWVIVVVPASLSLLWILLCTSIIGSCALKQQPIFDAELQSQVAIFTGSTALGVFLVSMHRYWLFWRKPQNHWE